MSKSIYSRRWLHRGNSDSSENSDADKSSTKRRTSHQPQPSRSPSPHPPGGFQMATPGGKLAQEIHDEFLVCKICLEGYKNPRCLNCLHTFCEECIENHVMSESTYKKYSDYREFTCPLCRKRTQLPIGGVKKLPDNFLVSSLTEVVARQKPSKFPFCDICKMVSRKHREASSKCIDCAKLLCTSCVELHRDTKVTSNHSLFDVQIEKDIECKEHEDEVVRFYCEPCQTCICVLCTFNEHKDHEITQFGEAVTKYKENIQKLLDNCKTKIGKFDSQMDSLGKCEEVMKEAESKIRETAISFIQEIRNREKQLVLEVQNIFGSDMTNQIQNKNEMASQVDGLRSTCSLTEVILKGKDIELLLLKKDVEEKLSSLNSVDIQSLPSTINKRINFVSGAVEFGYLQDRDRPLLSRSRIKKSASADADPANWPVFKEGFSQTDKDITQLPPKCNCQCGESESSGSDDSDEDSDSETDADDEDDEKPELADKDTQTAKVTVKTEDDVETRTISTITDEVKTEERGVNTRSRSLQTSNSLKDSDTSESSLAARRRRRRERAQTTQIGGQSMDDADQDDGPISYTERRKRMMNPGCNHSLDGDEVFYDAKTPASGHRV